MDLLLVVTLHTSCFIQDECDSLAHVHTRVSIAYYEFVPRHAFLSIHRCVQLVLKTICRWKTWRRILYYVYIYIYTYSTFARFHPVKLATGWTWTDYILPVDWQLRLQKLNHANISQVSLPNSQVSSKQLVRSNVALQTLLTMVLNIVNTVRFMCIFG